MNASDPTLLHLEVVTKVFYTEANFRSHNKFADATDPMNNPDPNATSPWWGGGYDGGVKSDTIQGMKSHAGTLLGYIHLR